ncbi:MAG: type II toxin-antitoxin system VapC family toxin [bacterium]
MRICIDTTTLIDILKDEFKSNQEKLYIALEQKEELITPSVVFAELMPQFKGDTKLLNLFLKDHKINIEPLDVKSVIASGNRWMKYLKRKERLKCPQCGNIIGGKEHFLSDFFIGGFALTNCDAIITRDRGIYKKYFPDLRII